MRRLLLSLSTLSLIILACSFVPRLNLPGAPALNASSIESLSPTASAQATSGPATQVAPTQTPYVLVINDLQDLYISLYQRLSPSVVHITSHTQVYDFFGSAVPEEGTGSGFVYDNQGHIVTNAHVVSGANEVEVALADGTTHKAKIVGTDDYNDLAVLKVDGLRPDQLKPLPLGSSHSLKVGMRVIAIGNPFGLDRTLTTGVISALGRTIERQDQAALGEMIQTDAAINPGNSGGPLLDLNGEVIGVNSNIQSPNGGSVGIGFAVPVDAVKRVVPDLISHGRYEHPSLSFNAYEIDSNLASLLKLPVQQGLLIAQVLQGGAADHAGVRGATKQLRTYGGTLLVGGDILTAIDGHPIATRDAMTLYLESNKRPGDKVTLTLLRDGQPLTVTATLDAR